MGEGEWLAKEEGESERRLAQAVSDGLNEDDPPPDDSSSSAGTSASWEDSYARLLAFPPDEDGTRSVPQQYTLPDGFRLGAWLAIQRHQQRLGKLQQIRFELLEQANVVWDPHARAWERALELFVAFPPDKKGRRIVPQSHVTDDGFKLGAWQV